MKSGEYSSAATEIVFVNPKAGSFSSQRHRRRWQDLLAREALVICPKSREETEALAARASADGVPRLLVVGGDGTLHHAINGILSHDIFFSLHWPKPTISVRPLLWRTLTLGERFKIKLERRISDSWHPAIKKSFRVWW